MAGCDPRYWSWQSITLRSFGIILSGEIQMYSHLLFEQEYVHRNSVIVFSRSTLRSTLELRCLFLESSVPNGSDSISSHACRRDVSWSESSSTGYDCEGWKWNLRINMSSDSGSRACAHLLLP